MDAIYWKNEVAQGTVYLDLVARANIGGFKNLEEQQRSVDDLDAGFFDHALQLTP